ncbi:MAG: diacylglycerol kinase family protein [Verrucomicrobiales bacterium]|nr:diacylglycerol kinase family protein [Verrucomicrobiales bacterium]
MLKTEWNFRIHLGMFFLAVLLGWFFKISAVEWLAVIICSALVIVAEVLNTSLEYLADAVHPEMDRGVGRAKDAAAAGVMIAAVAASVVGAIVFLPRTWEWLTTLIEK